MKVFISWSGQFSHKVALIFRDWLPKVVQSVDPYVSSEDIDKGTRWSIDVATELSDSFYGILCVTKENQGAPWLNFEAGALSRHLNDSNVSPLLIDMKKSEVVGPLQQFQLTISEKTDIKKLVFSIKSADKDCRLSDQQFDDVFEMWWPKLEDSLSKVAERGSTSVVPVLGITPPHEDSGTHNTNDALVEEILQLSRQQSRTLASQERVLLDLLEQNSRRPPRFSERDFSHPAVQDLLRGWAKVSQHMSPMLAEEPQYEGLADAVLRMDKAAEYILRHSNRYRNTSKLIDAAELELDSD